MRELTLAEWLRQLELQHPKAIDLGLERVQTVAKRLDVIRPRSQVVTVAGTNGKGSVVSVLEAALLAQGYKVGAYTSPHLIHFNERIRIAGEPASDAALISAFERVEAARGEVSLTYFEFATLAALIVFRDAEIDVQVLEVGLGGRLDAVNIIDANVAVVTSIGLDHLEWLGPDREHIAVEKAHIARAGRPVVVLEHDLPSTLLPTLDQIGARTLLIGRDFLLDKGILQTESGEQLVMPHSPGLLPANVAGALQALALLDGPRIDADVLSAVAGHSVPGRRQRESWMGAEMVLDVAHNLEAVEALTGYLDAAGPPLKTTYALYASLADKPFHDILRAVGDRVTHWYFPRFSDIARSVDPELLTVPAADQTAQVCDTFLAAWQAIKDRVRPGDRVLVFGSFIVVGAALEQLLDERGAD